MAAGRRPGRFDRLVVRPHGIRAPRHRPQPGLDLPPALRRRLRLGRSADVVARVRDADHLHRTCRRGRLPDAALQHRRRGAVLLGGGRRDRNRPRAGRPRRELHAGVHPRHGDRRPRRGRGLGGDPGLPPGLPAHERDHHLVDAQLCGVTRSDLPDHRQPLLLAGHGDVRGEDVSARQDDPGRGELADVHARQHRCPLRVHAGDRRRGLRAGRLPAHPFRVRAPGDRRLPSRGALCGHADAAQDHGGHVPVRRAGGPRGSEPRGRFRLPAGSKRASELLLRLHRDRRRRARALQPARSPPGRRPAGRVAGRGLRAPGAGLSLWARRRPARTDPLLRARRRAARSVPDSSRQASKGSGRAGRAEPGACGMSAALLLAGDVNDGFFVVIAASAVVYGTPLVYAALGELLAERSGVLNLGVEGMMLVGAVMGFWAVQRFHVTTTLALIGAILVAAGAGAAMGAIHAFLVVTLRANQIVSGLALTIFAGVAGLSSYLGNDLDLAKSPARHQFQEIFPKSWQDLDVVGPILFGQSALVYASWVCVVLVALYLTRTRVGLNVRAVGESPAAADAMGINVVAYRYAHTLVGGAFAGLGGATFSLSITPQWVTGLTQGAGWIAIALVIFAFWRPTLCLVGAYFFGAFTALPFALQGHGVTLAPELFQTLPYVATIVALVLVSSRAARLRFGAPAALGLPYVREER